MKLRVFCFSLMLFFLLTASVFAQNCAASQNLKNFGCVDANIYRGAQPNEAGVKELGARGIKTIISLRKSDEHARLEESWARAAGIRFINIPLANWFEPNKSRVAEIQGLLGAAENQPVFIHCQRGADRTGTAVAVYRIIHDGWTSEQVMKEAKSFHMGWWQVWMKDYIKDYYKEFQKQKSLTDL